MPTEIERAEVGDIERAEVGDAEPAEDGDTGAGARSRRTPRQQPGP
ncbi:hypothetical protein ACIRPX_29305 [Streptomyces sp. NPDC101225]